jgi:spore maturation protein CgeB
MRILVVDSYYPAVLEGLYGSQPQLSGLPYDVQWAAVMGLGFGTSDAYSYNLRAHGHDAVEVVPNCRPLQRAWARQHAPALLQLPWPLARPAILLAQSRALHPDIVYVQSIGALHPVVLSRLRHSTRLLAGQIATEVPDRARLGAFDVVLTSFPHFLGRLGVPTEFLRIGFDDRILERLGDVPQSHDVVFVGQLGRAQHRDANEQLETAARSLPIDFWGPGVDEWPVESPFRRGHHGTAWGLEMYRVLAGGRIALNRHGAVAEGHANNMRLYEATGVGTMLLTDQGKDLSDLFNVGTEVITYSGAADLVDKARWYLDHDAEREAVASAGQVRTLRDHTYAMRMTELVEILDRYLRSAGGVSRMMSSRRSKL